MTQKQATLKLFFNSASGVYYVQVNEDLYTINEKVALLLQDREGLTIRRCKDLKDVQETSIADKHKPDSL